MSLSHPSATSPRYWWHTATIYELYPSSFKDSNNDGIGDIPGIISRIPYLASLGIDAVWLAACYKSGGVDMGYDVVDYRNIDSQYGTVEDIEKLIEELGKVGIRLVMDMVVNHTSDQHPWFKESRLSKENEKRHWYIWRRGKTSIQADGTQRHTPPNNWSSVFGGPAWTYDEASEEWYLHIFAKEQPDLNWANPHVREAIYSDMRFWLQKGVAGFRMDVINLISKPENLEDLDAPVVDPQVVEQPAFGLICNGSRIHEYLQEMRKVVLDPFFSEPGQERMMVGEVICTSDPGIIRQYTDPHRKELDMAYNYDLFEWLHDGPRGKFSAWNPPKPREEAMKKFKNLVTQWQTSLAYPKGGWGTIWLESHDTARSASRFLDLTAPNLSAPEQAALRWRVAKLLALLQSTLGGTLFIYQGQELGLTNLSDAFPVTEYVDVESKRAWQMEYNTRMSDLLTCQSEAKAKAIIDMSGFETQMRLKARDHARMPLPWMSSPTSYFGFSETELTDAATEEAAMKTWSPMNTDTNECNVFDQDRTPDSALNFWRKCLALRNERTETLVFGSFSAAAVSKGGEEWKVFAYWRRRGAAVGKSFAEEDRDLLIVMNLTAEEGVEAVLPRIPGVEKHDGKLAMYEWVAGTAEGGKLARGRMSIALHLSFLDVLPRLPSCHRRCDRGYHHHGRHSDLCRAAPFTALRDHSLRFDFVSPSNSDTTPEHFPRRFLYPPITKQKAQGDVLSIRNFTRLVEKGEAGVPEATAILQASCASLEDLPLDKQRDKAAAAGASQILRWLLGTDSKNWDVTITRELTEPLCWHLEAEGRTDTVQTWLEIWAKDASLRQNAVKKQSFHPQKRFSWPGSVLAGMVRAKIYWHPMDVGPALALVLSVFDAAKGHIHFGYAIAPLHQAVVSASALPCDINLFSRFKDLVHWSHRGSIQFDSQIVRLQLADPVNPDPQGAIQFCQNEQHTAAVLCWSEKAKRSMSQVILRAAYICYLKGEWDNATFLKSWSVKLHSSPFEIYSSLCGRWQEDPKLKGLHESAATKGLDYMSFAKDMAD